MEAEATATVRGHGIVPTLLELAYVDRDDWESSVQHILRVDAQMLGVERVNLWTLRREPLRIFCEAGYIQSLHLFERGRLILASDQPAYFAALEHERMVVVDDARADPRTQGMHDYLVMSGITSMLDVPLRVQGALAGVLCHEHVGETRRQWTEADFEFAAGLAHVVTSSLEARARTKAEREAKRAAFLDRASRVLLRARDADEVAHLALDLVVPDLAEWSVLDVLERGDVRRAGWAHADPRRRALLERMSREFPPTLSSPHLSAKTIRLQASVLVDDVKEDELARYTVSAEHAEFLRALGPRSAAGVPLVLGGRVLGSLAVFSRERNFDNQDVRLFEELAERIAAALENAHLHAAMRGAIAARDDFLALAAHELRTPLTSLQLAADALVRKKGIADPTHIAHASDTIARKTRQLTRLIDEMLEASQLRAGMPGLSLGPTDLRALARAAIARFAESARRAGCTITLDAPSSVTGEWDAARLERVLDALIANAIKFGAGKPIELVVRDEGDAGSIEVRDHGIGIRADLQEAIFDPFERAVPKSHYGGLGLGLFISKRIVDAHGGKIDVTSAPERGATFVVRLPRSVDHQAVTGSTLRVAPNA